jgi:hypothetical protein
MEYLFFHFERNTCAVVAYPDLHAVAKVLCSSSEGGLVVGSVRFRLALCHSVEPVRDQVEQYAGNFLRE